MKEIYLDHSATTYTDPIVLQEMLPYFTEVFGNASSQHKAGRESLKAVDVARERIAKAIGCLPSEVYFTSGGSESDNWAIKGMAEMHKDKGNHIITTKIEHPAVIQTCKALEKQGFEVTYLDVDSEGIISTKQLEDAITERTILISVMFANNEMGAIQPIAEIGEIAKKHKIAFHTDAVQAVGNVPIDVKAMNIDMLSMSGHKFYGPKGVGVLYKRNGLRIGKFMDGGEQERNMRAGTINTPAIVGMGKAIELAVESMQANNEHIAKLRDYFVSQVLEKIPHIYFNGPKDMSKRLANNASFSFEYVEGESILMRLDMQGIRVSSGSACSSGSLEPSYVMLSIGVPIEIAHGTIRFSFGKSNTMEQTQYVIDQLVSIIDNLRDMSPLFKEIKGEKIYV
ncbi:MAG: cysteine desulfurase NifS [Clostridia bacterium]|nr:cysteine desulfurase NifS [Clostridia bacterium]MDY4083458.1 cysteine desulfurase NifS [Eubacteriales bacterium]